jgi:hypothetical protein
MAPPPQGRALLPRSVTFELQQAQQRPGAGARCLNRRLFRIQSHASARYGERPLPSSGHDTDFTAAAIAVGGSDFS